LWLGDIAALPPDIAPDICSPAEQDRARRFASRGDAARYLQTRALLRQLLSAYVGQPPEAIGIDEAKDGKPYVRDGAIAFNLSHSGPCVAIAVRVGAEPEAGLGVDVHHGRRADELALARSLFADSEIAMLAGLGKAARHRPFFRLWACREAVLKTSGLGMKGGMKGRGFSLRLDARGAYAVHALSPAWNAIALHEFQPRRDVFGALAWRQTGTRPQIRQFEICRSAI